MFENRPKRKEFKVKAIIKDGGDGKWEIQKHIRPGKQEGTLIIEVELRVNKDRDIVHVPWLTIFPGLGTFGEKKYQGLFAGVEYLCDEPSSSDADIAKPEHIRRVPDPVKITFPLMAIAHNGNYIGVIWEPSDMVSATFDSPDRIYNSGAHLMALSAPAVGELRFENELSARTPFKLEANKPLKVSVLIIGGKGKTIVPAVKRYVDLRGVPAVPRFEGGFNAAVDLLAHGWLERLMPQCSSTGWPIIPEMKNSARDSTMRKNRHLVKSGRDSLSQVVFRTSAHRRRLWSSGELMNSCSSDAMRHCGCSGALTKMV